MGVPEHTCPLRTDELSRLTDTRIGIVADRLSQECHDPPLFRWPVALSCGCHSGISWLRPFVIHQTSDITDRSEIAGYELLVVDLYAELGLQEANELKQS